VAGRSVAPLLSGGWPLHGWRSRRAAAFARLLSLALDGLLFRRLR
jgi:hypothetical protein